MSRPHSAAKSSSSPPAFSLGLGSFFPSLSDDEEVEVLDVPLSQRLRQRPVKVEKKVKRKRREDGDEDEDEDGEGEDEDEDEDGDGVEDDDGSRYSPDDDDGSSSSSRRQQKGGGRPVSASEIAALKEIIGAHLSTANCVQLIKKANYDIQRAVNDYYAQLNDDAEEEQKTPASKASAGRPLAKGHPIGQTARRGGFPHSFAVAPRAVNTASPSTALSSTASTSPPSSSSSSSSPFPSSFPSVVKPGQRASQWPRPKSYAEPSSSDEDSSDEEMPDYARRRVRRPAAQRGGRGGGLMKKGRGGRRGFDPNLPPADYHTRPADSSLPSNAQRMSSYVEDMDVDAKIAGKWFPVKVLKVFDVGHVVQVNHADWPPECAVYIDPISNNLAPSGTKRNQYFEYDQVDTFITPPAKPSHPDAALYTWPGVKEDDTDASLLLGTISCKVTSDRVYGMKEWYDTLVPTDEDEASVKRWRLVETWLKKQSKLIEVEEKVVEVMEFGRPAPSLQTKAGKRVQERLHDSYSWKLVERWLKLGYDLREIKRSHHKDEDDEWKTTERINDLVQNRGVGMPGGAGWSHGAAQRLHVGQQRRIR